MIPASVRMSNSAPVEVVAFVAIATEPDEVRVRWRPGSWRCDMCGASTTARCAHARAVASSDAYQYDLKESARTRRTPTATPGQPGNRKESTP